jgi:Stress responsive A/B Barrel Domain
VILHIALFRWKEGVTAEDVATVEQELAAFRPKIPVILDYRYGPDQHLRDGNADFAVLALVAGEEELHAYLDDPAHKEFVARVLVPRMTGREAMQLRVESPPIGQGALGG